MAQEIDISRLTPAECIVLAEQLWEKARQYPEAVPVPPAQLVELNRRLDALEAGKLPPSETWEQVKAGLLPR